MITILSIIALGFFLGMRHATDPDHVIAVSTIVARHRTVRDAAWIGVFWGIGHSLTVLAVGGAIILLGWVVPARVGLSMEFSVGLMLILLGALNLGGLLRRVDDIGGASAAPQVHAHSHAHAHGEYVHTHAHGHSPEQHPHRPDQTPLGWLDRHFGRLSLYQMLRPLAVGIVHGMAGSAAVALLVLATIQDARWAMLYLVVFGVGTIGGMMLVTAAIAAPLAYAGSRFAQVHRGLRIASGLVSVGFGLFIAYRIGVVEGLFGLL